MIIEEISEIIDRNMDELETNLKAIAAKAVQEAYEKGMIAGLKRFAWWKDGVEYVGTCGTTLKAAIAALEAS